MDFHIYIPELILHILFWLFLVGIGVVIGAVGLIYLLGEAVCGSR